MKITTLRIHHSKGIYSHISLFDLMQEIVFSTGFVEIDYAIGIYFAKHHYDIINLHKSVDEFMSLNEDIYYWQNTIYGEFILKKDFEKEIL